MRLIFSYIQYSGALHVVTEDIRGLLARISMMTGITQAQIAHVQ